VTIDGESTLDFDDALSIESDGAYYRVGIHIADVAHFIRRDDPLDREALARGSSIYTPDRKVSMLPPQLSEDVCSLKAGEHRPALSIFIRMDRFAETIGYEIVPSVVRVARRLTYDQADALAETDQMISALWNLAVHFRQKRLASGALHINLPEIGVWAQANGEVTVTQTDREKPGRMLVAEMMIMANWVMAGFLHKEGLPAVFRSQPKPKNRILKNGESTLFENCLQRKHLSRVVLADTPDYHTGLGLNAYVTGTSPIRKYFDLVTQRQVRAVLGLGKAYQTDEIQELVQKLERPLQNVSKIQFQRHRYWLLKYLEGRQGLKEEAIVLDKRRDNHLVVLTQYMLECRMPQPSGSKLRPGDLVQVTVQYVNARSGKLLVFMG
jgi:exoribonuclease-2